MKSHSYLILNSNGNWTIETNLITEIGNFISSLPTGTSKGKREVKYRINSTIKELNSKEIPKINSIEDIFEFEKSFHNPPLTLSFSLLKYLAKKQDKGVWELLNPKGKLPYLWNKIVGGGLHAGGPAIQEFLISVREKRFIDRVKIALEVHKEFGKKLKIRGHDLEGGWVVDSDSISVLKRLKEVVEKVKDKYSTKILIGLDVAASTIYMNKKYVYKNFILNPEENIRFLNDLIKEFKIYYVEDPVNQDDNVGCKKIKAKLVVGDDLITSNPERIGVVKGINGVIAKPNQIGYLYKFVEFIKKAKKRRYKIIVSHRSQETNDDILADLSVAYGDLKIGLVGGERVSKINRLIKISNEL